jgi:hypothetical protein
MGHRFLASMSVVATVIAVVSLAALPVAGQAPRAAADTWTPPHTPWGHPDLQGIWTNETITPFERPSELAGREFLTEGEASQLEQQTAQKNAAADGTSPPGSVGGYNQFWMDSGSEVLSTRQTSLVVDPPDGRVPVRPEAEAKRDDNRAHSTDSYEYMSLWDRCITRGVPGSMFPTAYNNAYQILQTPGYVVILYEMIHDARIIPLDGGAHVVPKIRLWMGDSRGHWEGNTLVVDTTNFTDKGRVESRGASRRIMGIPQSEALHVVERFKLVDADTIGYEVTIEDPEAYTRPWKVGMPLKRNQDYQMFEYACHEGNTAIELVLGGARAEGRAAEKEAEKKEPLTR